MLILLILYGCINHSLGNLLHVYTMFVISLCEATITVIYFSYSFTLTILTILAIFVISQGVGIK